jgi:hypothetical protein
MTKQELIEEIQKLDKRGYDCTRRGETTNAHLAWGEMNDLEQQLTDCDVADE